MSIKEASALSGFAPFTISQACNRNEILATKPRGNRGGWHIEPSHLSAWIQSRKRRGANSAMADAMKRGIA